jgi:hypothetical protein
MQLSLALALSGSALAALLEFSGLGFDVSSTPVEPSATPSKAELVSVPYIYGMGLEEAREVLDAVGLELSARMGERRIDPEVYRQYRVASTAALYRRVPVGSQIEVVVEFSVPPARRREHARGY